MEPTGLLVVLCLLHASGADLAFQHATASVTVPENETSIYKLNVTGGTVSSYEINEGASTTASILFEAVKEDNLVKLKSGQSLDYETKSTHTLSITAIGNTASTSASMTLTVSVTNVAPSFGNAQTKATIANGTSAGTAAGTFKATDRGNSPVKHAIVCGNTNTDFAMDKTTGEVTVATGKTIVVERTPCYTLVLHAVDNATSPLTGSTTVVITVSGRSGSATCTADSNPCPRSRATYLAVSPLAACFMALLSLILSTILGR